MHCGPVDVKRSYLVAERPTFYREARLQKPDGVHATQHSEYSSARDACTVVYVLPPIHFGLQLSSLICVRNSSLGSCRR